MERLLRLLILARFAALGAHCVLAAGVLLHPRFYCSGYSALLLCKYVRLLSFWCFFVALHLPPVRSRLYMIYMVYSGPAILLQWPQW